MCCPWGHFCYGGRVGLTADLSILLLFRIIIFFQVIFNQFVNLSIVA